MSQEILGISIMMGISLAAVTGLRAFLPLAVVGWLAHAGTVDLGTGFRWLASDPALLIFTVATVLEIAADKIPVVDNVLDHIADYIKPVAGAIVTGGMITQWDPLTATVFGLIAGGSTAALFHQAKKLTRIASTGATLGLGNPIISAAEDVFSGLGILTAIVLPVLAFSFVALVSYFLYRGGKRVVLWYRSRTMVTPLPQS